LFLADPLELGAPCRFNFWLGHQLPFSRVGSFATVAAMRRLRPWSAGSPLLKYLDRHCILCKPRRDEASA
jgi:hypothetical protein